MKSIQSNFRLTLISVALTMAFDPAWGQDADVNELAKPDSSVSAGAGYWSNDRPHEGRHDAMHEKGGYGLVDVDIIKRDDATGTWLKLQGSNLGLDNRELRGEYNRQGKVGGFVEYNKTSYDNPYTFTTGTQGIGTTNLTVGSNLAGGTFPRSEVHLGTERELWRLGGYQSIMPGLDFKVDFKTEHKTGTRQTGWGSAAMFSAEPTDSTTRQLETILRYTGDKLQLSGGYYGTWYQNDNPMIRQTVFGATDAGITAASSPAMTPLSQPLSNQAHQAFLDGGYNFTPTTRGTFKLAYTKATQDEALPGSGLTGANLPWAGAPSSLNGEVNTTLVQLGISSRPLRNLSINGSLRYYDVNDKTPLRGFVGSGTTPSVWNTPQSFTTTTGKIEATYRLPMNYSITGGIDYSDQDRSYPTVGAMQVPFRADLKETTSRVEVKRSLTDSVNGKIAYLHSARDGSNFVQAGTSAAAQENQINPMHISDRTRNKWRAAFDWDPNERLSLQVRIDHAQDKYPQYRFDYGLKDGSAEIYAIDATYLISEKWKLSGWYSYDQTKARTRVNAGSTATPSATVTQIKDTGNSFGADLRGTLSPRMDVSFGAEWFQNNSNYQQNYGATAPAAGTTVPEVKNNLFRLKANGKYALDKASEIRLDLIYERWHAEDATWSFANGSPFSYGSGYDPTGGAGIANDGTTVTQKATQSATFIGIRYIYRFQ